LNDLLEREISGSGANILSRCEERRSFNIVPILLGEGVDLLLETLLAFGKALVLADSHNCDEIIVVWAVAESGIRGSVWGVVVKF